MDNTEQLRRQLQQDINSNPKTREELEKQYGLVWDTEELQKDFTVQGFLAPFAQVIRKEDGTHGSLMFQHNPRFYYCFL